jgi:TRAP-type C4-dicarboxylate transport system substrate-binding protein
MRVEGLSISTLEVYVGLQKGILDGLIGPIETLEVLKLAEVAKCATMINSYRTHMGMRMMNLNKWNSLPPDIKKVFDSNREYYGQETEAETSRGNLHATDFGKKLGVEFIPISKEETAKFYAPIKTVAQTEARELDAKGLPGTKILNEAQPLILLYSK